MQAITLLTLLSLNHLSLATYTLVDNYDPTTFFNNFTFFSGSDPTNGHVQYANRPEAHTKSLAGSLPNQQDAIYLGVDHASPAPSGRPSVRVSSNKAYQHGLFAADIAHMPGGICGVWPAFWLLGSGTWPQTGEIDIIEGVNDQAGNLMTLHTNAGCSVTRPNSSSSSASFTGNLTTPDCDVNAAGQEQNAGCQIDGRDNPVSFGAEFNSVQGGVYALEWTSQAITIWFFARNQIPSDLLATNTTSTTPNPSQWPTPVARFAGCDIDVHFQNMSIIFDTTFCGAWAGKVWTDSPACAAKASTCEEYVSDNPAAFVDAYWAVNSVRVWQDS